MKFSHVDIKIAITGTEIELKRITVIQTKKIEKMKECDLGVGGEYQQ